MLSIPSVFLLCVLCVIRCNICEGQAVPTKSEICGKPTFQGGLAISDSAHVSNTTRYLFRGKYVMPFDFGRRKADFSKIVEINSMFKASPKPINAIVFAFWAKDQVYICAKGEEKDILVFKRSGSHFTYKKTHSWSTIDFEYLKWNITTVDGTSSVTKTMYFMDNMPKVFPANTSKSTPGVMDFTYKSGKIELNYDGLRKSKIVYSLSEIFPNTMMFWSKSNAYFALPIEYNGYYQTKTHEYVFFKGEAACLYDPHEEAVLPAFNSDYCHTFINTRHLIGCTTSGTTGKTTGPEIFPGEPNDIDPNF